ncbi:hypothetical protein PC112_g8214 [Phytophthora cactorum]|nr:hypothetical protein PC112_g8214 [Phytophthora cactorum]
MLLHDDEMEALEAALSFVDAFSHDGSVILHASEAPRGSPIQSSSPSVPTSVGLSGGGGVIADEELESLLLEVGLSGSPSTNSGVKTEPAALVATSQAASPTDSAAVANNSFTQVNSNDSENARRVSRGGTEQATSGKTKKRVRLNPNRARDNRKNELAYLRNKVKQMEEQLLSLRQQYIENKDSTNTTTTTRSIVETAPPGTFFSIRIPCTNAQMREGPEGMYVDIFTNKMLPFDFKTAAEAVWTHFRGSEKHRGNLYENFSKDVESSSDTVAEMDDEVEALEAALSYVEALPPSQPALEISAASSTTAFPEGFGAGDEGEVRLDAELDRLLLGTLSSSSEHVTVTAAVWNHFKGSEKHRGVVYENATKHLETSSDTIMEAFTMEFLGKTTTADFRVKQVIRRFVESDRQVVVWVSIGHALDPNNSPFSSFGFVDKGYVVTRRPMSIAPGHGDFTILQMCSLVSPQMSAGCRIDMTAAGDFTEFVLNVVAANTTTSQEIIENVLLDQALNKRQVETSLAA